MARSADPVPRFDLTLTGGDVIDGWPDALPRRLDVGIEGGRITALGDLGEASAHVTIDVTGRIVAPGFIDPHTHLEAALLAGTDDVMAPVRQGVTTCLTGADGFGWAPLPEAAARELWSGTTGINGSYPEAMDPTTVEGYLRSLEAAAGPNLLPQVPHGAIRFAACGWAGGAPAEDGLRAMADAVGAWMANGATGLAVGLDYEPAARAAEEELIALADPVGRAGGTLAAHLRYQDAGRPAAWRELVRVARASGVALVIAHETLDDEGLALLAAARHSVDVAVEAYLYPAASTHLAMFMPHALRVGGPAAIAERLADPAIAGHVAAELDRSLGAELDAGERFVFAASADPDRVGSDLGELAEATGTTPGAFAARVLRDDIDALFVIHHPVSDSSDAAAVRTIRDDSMIVASDGIYGPGRMHPRGYGTFPRVLRTFVRERGVISLGEAVHRMTQRTAARYRVPGRGTIEIGKVADLVTFDPATVADRATWDEPRRAPAGIDHVLISGEPVVRDGQPTGVHAGRILAAA